MKIGIPNALIFYKHPKLWTTFLKELGHKVIQSPKTTREILNLGVSRAEDEACLPIKVIVGHALWLKDKVDKVFIPRYFSLYKNEWGCPKFFGLPDILESYGIRILTVEVGREYEKEQVENPLETALWELGEKLGNQEKIGKALDKALRIQREYEQRKWNEYEIKKRQTKDKLLLVSHEYNLHDPSINLGIQKILEEKDCVVIPIDSVPFKFQPKHSDLINWFMRWDFGTKLLQQVESALPYVDGVIQITTFACGPDSFLCEFIEDLCTKVKKPYMKLMFDEHTAIERVRNRIEAFLESMRMRK